MEQWSWSDQSFCERVAERCKALGKSQRSVLREAQCAHDYLQTNPQHGRRIDRIVRIAEVLELGIGDILGVPVNGDVDGSLLLVAYRAAQQAMQNLVAPDDVAFVETMTTVYNRLLARRAQGHDVHDPQYLEMMIDVLRGAAASRLPRTKS